MSESKKIQIIGSGLDADFIESLKEALNLEAGTELTFVTPQFDRPIKQVISYFPTTVEEYDSLADFSEENLLKLGLGIWTRSPEKIHWLFPREWYSCIPEGYVLRAIDDTEEVFHNGVSDDDSRMGMLAYGFIQNLKT